MENLELFPPVDGHEISRTFDQHLRPRGDYVSRVPGIDFDCPEGTAVRAAAGGVVTSSRYGDSGGRYLIIRHGDGIQTLYSHLDTIYVLQGEPVEAGQVIALSGSTGYCDTPHLHFAVKLAGSGWVNPIHQFAPAGSKFA